jgi:erythrin-vacuolar iron transport family protein
MPRKMPGAGASRPSSFEPRVPNPESRAPLLTPSLPPPQSTRMPTIDFASLSLQDALDLAILIEEEAQERYEEFSESLSVHHTPDASHFFALMAGNEAKHGAELRKRREVIFGDAPVRVSRAMLWDVEAPGYDEPRIYMTVRQAMEVALASEVKAYDFFDAALDHITNTDVRVLFEELRAEEVEHQEMVKEVMARVPPDERIVYDDEDEPVGQ